MSDFDSEDYSSSEDEDYVPSDEDDSEDDVNDLVKEDDIEEGEGEKPQKKKGKKSSKGITVRKRKKGQLLLGGEEVGEKEDKETPTAGEEEASVSEEGPIKEEDEKKRADALWASFLSDLGPKVIPPAAVPALRKENKQTTATSGIPRKEQEQKQDEAKPQEPTKVKITKVFDFAGEEVRVTKEVDANSKEAQTFFKERDLVQKSQSEPQPIVEEAKTDAGSTSSGVKRPAGLGNILGKIGGKKQKLSTLEKSKLDWEVFKEQEGIGDELAIFNRGKKGYIERKAFLQRVDQREFEHERKIRLSNMKR